MRQAKSEVVLTNKGASGCKSSGRPKFPKVSILRDLGMGMQAIHLVGIRVVTALSASREPTTQLNEKRPARPLQDGELSLRRPGPDQKDHGI